MKTQIIQLEENDDALSVRDKLSWSPAGRVVLVWPMRGKILNQKLDLKLVQRFAASSGVQLALVSQDPQVSYHAHLLGLPVFMELSSAQDREWEIQPSQKVNLKRANRAELEQVQKHIHPASSRWSQHWAISLLALGLCLLALLSLGVFIIPGARITITPHAEVQSMNIEVCADASADSIDISAGCLPTYSQEVVLEEQDSIPASGTMRYPDQLAAGTLIFTNSSNQTAILPGGTVVTTDTKDPTRFITVNVDEITIPPGQAITVEARAVKPGPAGNLAADSLVMIEGWMDPGVIVTNPYPTSGGSEIDVPAPTAQDLQTLRARLEQKIIQGASTELDSLVPEGDTLIPASISVVDNLLETPAPSIGEPGNLLELTVRLRLRAEVVPGEPVRSLAAPILDANLPEGYIPISNSLALTRQSEPVLESDGCFHWSISASRKLQAEIQEIQAADRIKGSTIKSAQKILSASMPLAAPAQITIIPRWWPWLPLLTMRMQLVKAELP